MHTSSVGKTVTIVLETVALKSSFFILILYVCRVYNPKPWTSWLEVENLCVPSTLLMMLHVESHGSTVRKAAIWRIAIVTQSVYILALELQYGC